MGPAAAGRPLRSMSPGLRCAPASSFTCAKRPPGHGGARRRWGRRIVRGLCGWVQSGYLGRMPPVVGTGSAVMECLMKRILSLAAVLAAGTFPVAAMAAPACADLVVVD